VAALTLASSVSENLTNPPSKKEVIRVTLDKGPRSRDQWIQAILLVKSFKLVPKPLDKGSKPKSDKLRMTKKDANWTENQLVQSSDQKTVLKGELLIWRTKNQARDQGTVQLKDSICFKSVQIGS
jgi:hypothetical protein